MELDKIEQWFKANKRSSNLQKTKYTLFHKNYSKDDIPLKIPDLKIENLNIVRNYLIVFVSNACWAHKLEGSYKHSRIQKKAYYIKLRQVLTEASLKTIYFSYIHLYLNYKNIAWASTNVTNPNKIHLLQKRSVHLVLDNYTLDQMKILLQVIPDHYYEKLMP